VINQMTGEWGVSNPALWHLNRQATALAKPIPGGVRYRWIPREENQAADTLAGGQFALATTPLVAAPQTGGAAVAAALAEQIARLNGMGKMSAKRGDGTDESAGGARIHAGSVALPQRWGRPRLRSLDRQARWGWLARRFGACCQTGNGRRSGLRTGGKARGSRPSCSRHHWQHHQPATPCVAFFFHERREGVPARATKTRLRREEIAAVWTGSGERSHHCPLSALPGHFRQILPPQGRELGTGLYRNSAYRGRRAALASRSVPSGHPDNVPVAIQSCRITSVHKLIFLAPTRSAWSVSWQC
jgi:hypothetical protein